MRALHALTYGTWDQMKRRCHDPGHHKYRLYGGRGIAVCERWRNSFANFLKDMGERSGREYSIDRVDRDGDYEPGNCRWATAAEQRANSPDVITVEVPLFELARMLGLDPAAVRYRYRVKGWSLARSLELLQDGSGAGLEQGGS